MSQRLLKQNSRSAPAVSCASRKDAVRIARHFSEVTTWMVQTHVPSGRLTMQIVKRRSTVPTGLADEASSRAPALRRSMKRAPRSGAQQVAPGKRSAARGLLVFNAGSPGRGDRNDRHEKFSVAPPGLVSRIAFPPGAARFALTPGYLLWPLPGPSPDSFTASKAPGWFHCVPNEMRRR